MINFGNIYDFRAEHISFRTNQIIWKVQFNDVFYIFEWTEFDQLYKHYQDRSFHQNE